MDDVDLYIFVALGEHDGEDWIQVAVSEKYGVTDLFGFAAQIMGHPWSRTLKLLTNSHSNNVVDKINKSYVGL